MPTLPTGGGCVRNVKSLLKSAAANSVKSAWMPRTPNAASIDRPARSVNFRNLRNAIDFAKGIRSLFGRGKWEADAAASARLLFYLVSFGVEILNGCTSSNSPHRR